MGSRTADKLKEIDEVRASLGAKLSEIERRLPLAGFGKKMAAGLAGSSVAGSVLAFGFRRLRGKRGKRKKSSTQDPPVSPAAVTVNVFPKGAAYLAAAGLVGWAGFKVFEAIQARSAGGGNFKPAVVTQMPESGRQAGT